MLSVVVLACYLACAVWLASSVWRAADSAAQGRRIAGVALGVLAVALHGVLLQRTLFVDSTPSFGVTTVASLIGWAMGIIAIALAWLRPRFAALAAIITAAAGFASIANVDGQSAPALQQQDWEIGAHIILSTIAYAFLSIAVVLAIAVALLDRRLRSRRPLGGLAILPSMEALETGAFQALAAGFALLTFALFSGFIFVDDLLGQHLIHKTVLSCLAWLVFAVLLFGRWRFGWRGRTATSWTLSGFALLALAYFGSKIVLETILGRHWG